MRSGAQAADRSAGAAEQSVSLFRDIASTWRGNAADLRAISRLNLEPDVRIDATLYPVKTPNREIPPNIVISNVGPVEAIQLKVNFIAIRRKSGTTGMFAVHDSANEWSIDSLSPGKFAEFDASTAIRSVGVVGAPCENALLLRMEWRRDPDRKLFRGFLIFLPSPDGRWVHATDNSLTSEDCRSTRDLIESRESKLNFDMRFNAPKRAPAR